MRRRRSERGGKGLDEAQHGRHCAQNGVWILFGRPSAQFDKDQHKTDNCQRPRQHHERAMPREPLVFAAQRTAHPCLLEVSRQQDASRRRSDPGGQHERSVQTQQQHGFAAERTDFGQTPWGSGRNATNIVIANAVWSYTGPRRDKQVELATDQIELVAQNCRVGITFQTTIDAAIDERSFEQSNDVLWLQGIFFFSYHIYSKFKCA